MITEVPSKLAFLGRPTWEGESGTVIATLSPTMPDNLMAIHLVQEAEERVGQWGGAAWECGLPEGMSKN